MLSQFKTLFKQTSLYGIFNILGKSAGFLMLPIYTRYLTPEDYGIIEIIEVSASIFELFASAGIAYAVFKFYHKYDDQKRKNSVISTTLTAVLLSHLLLSAIALIFSERLAVLIFNDPTYQYFLILVFCRVVLTGAVHFGVDYLRVTDRLAWYGFFFLGRFVLTIAFNIWFLVFLGMGVEAILLGNILGTLLIGLPLVIFIYAKVGMRFDFALFWPILRYGLPFLGVLIGQFIINAADRFILQHYSGLSEVGIYSLGYRFGFMVNFLIVSPFLLMWETKLFEIEKQENAKEMYARMFTYFLLGLTISAVALSVFSKEVVILMAAPEYYDAAVVIPFIAFAFLFNGLQEFARLGMLLKNKTHIVGTVMVVQCVLSVGLYFLLIPIWGVVGAGTAVLLSYISVFIAYYLYSQSLYKVNYEIGRIIKIVITTLVILGVNYYINIESFMLSILTKIGLMILFVIILFALGFLDEKEKSAMESVSQPFLKRIIP